MKHIKTINEVFGIQRLFNKDERTAEGILKRLKTDNNIIVSQESTRLIGGVGGKFIYKLNIDDFNIEIIFSISVSKLESTTGYLLKIDDVIMDSSKSINKKIYKKCEEIYNKDEIEMKDYIKKDARINFAPRKK